MAPPEVAEQGAALPSTTVIFSNEQPSERLAFAVREPTDGSFVDRVDEGSPFLEAVSMRHTGRMAATVDDDARRAALERQMEFVAANDAVASHAIYHDDAVLEFPQSGERFEGVDNFREWRARYPTKVEFRIRRISGSGDVWVREMSVSYDGGAWMLGVAVLEFRGDRIARERIYVTEQWDPPEWRAPWRAATTAV